MKKILKLTLLITVFSLFLFGCKENEENVTVSIVEDTYDIGRTTLNFTLNVNDPNAKDDKLSVKIVAYAYEIVQGIGTEIDLNLTDSYTVDETVEEVELDGLTQETNYRLIIKKTSGEETVLLEKDFKTTNVGSKENPISISTIEEFYTIADDMNAHYKLTADLDFNDYVNKNDGDKNTYSYLGSSTKPFKGVLDGDGHTIKNINNFAFPSSAYYFGLFATIEYEGVVKNLNFQNIKFSTANAEGTLVTKSIEYIGIVAGYNEGTIENVTFDGITIEAGLSRSTSYVGVVAGVNDGTIEDVTVKNASIKLESTLTNFYVGGVCGMLGKDAEGLGKKVSKANVNVNLNIKTQKNSMYVGGLVGEARGDINNSYVAGKVDLRTETTATSDFKNSLYAGGLVGKHTKGYVSTSISNLESINISSSFAAKINVGGLVGQSGINSITNCLTTTDINVLFDTQEQYAYKVKENDVEVSPYVIGFTNATIADKAVEIVKDCYVVSGTAYNIGYVTEDITFDDVVVSENVVNSLAKDFYKDTLGFDENIWDLENLTENMPVLK